MSTDTVTTVRSVTPTPLTRTVTSDPGQVSALLDDNGDVLVDDDGDVLVWLPTAAGVRTVETVT